MKALIIVGALFLVIHTSAAVGFPADCRSACGETKIESTVIDGVTVYRTRGWITHSYVYSFTEVNAASLASEHKADCLAGCEAQELREINKRLTDLVAGIKQGKIAPEWKVVE